MPNKGEHPPPSTLDIISCCEGGVLDIGSCFGGGGLPWRILDLLEPPYPSPATLRDALIFGRRLGDRVTPQLRVLILVVRRI